MLLLLLFPITNDNSGKTIWALLLLELLLDLQFGITAGGAQETTWDAKN